MMGIVGHEKITKKDELKGPFILMVYGIDKDKDDEYFWYLQGSALSFCC